MEASRLEPGAVGRPRDDRIDRAVLDATIELLTEGSYADLTLTAVAARAGTSVPAVRRRWPSKLHLVHQAVFPTDVAVPPRRVGVGLREEMELIVNGCVLLVSLPSMVGAITGLMSDLAADPNLQAQLTDGLWGTVKDDLAGRFADAARHDGVTLDVDLGLIAEAAFGSALLAAGIRGADQLDETWQANMVDFLMAGIGVPNGSK
ncbi:TetR/AcrR family transcriptional regulator [Gordonia sp. (in: high G+C Gram-positive bacteria)]|uniref:TetR/AcrR family transcriptional regulator n=1 Tax=Gordonia sp. (in: high G+C Gram-positive bacteria) TaxID=84139 RepID=UPI003C77B9E4